MSKQRKRNPWNLTIRQEQVMDALCEHGCNKGAARHLGLDLKTVETHVQRAGIAFADAEGKPLLRTIRVLMWDRWRRGEGKGVVA